MWCARLLPLLLIAAPAMAQDAPPSARDFQLEPAPTPRVDPRLQGPGLTPRPAPLQAERTPAQAPPRAAEAPPAPAVDTPAPPPSTAENERPSAQSPARSGPAAGLRTAAPSRVTTPTPVAADPAETGTAEGSAGNVEAAPPAASATTPAVPPVSVAEPEPVDGPSHWPLVVFALAGLAVVGAASIAWRRRGRGAAGRRRVPAPLPKAEPPSPRTLAPAPTPRPAMPAAGPLPAPPPAEPLSVGFEPLEASANALGSTLRCRLTITNHAPGLASAVSLRLHMAGAGLAGDAALAAWLADDAGGFALDDLAPGETRVVERSLRVGARDFRPIQLADRAIFVPLVGVVLSATVGGEPVRIAAAHVVGRSPGPGGKMGPFRVDQGPRHYRELDGRPHALAG